MAESGLRVQLRQDAPIPLDVSFDCAAGELLALVGPSGSGKTSILRAIAGLMAVASGRISCGDQVWFDSTALVNLSPQARRVGMVFQSYALFPHLTALANVMEGVAAPMAARAQVARDWLRRVHLEDMEHRLPRQLSGGQQQRVAVARALAGQPRALLLDEPFAALDRSTRERLHEELAELHQQLDIPTILVTHDLDEAAVLADRLCILSKGRLLQKGTPTEVMRRPVSTQVARMVGLANIFNGRVVEHGPEATLIAWHDHKLRVRRQPAFAVGAPITWAIPAAGVLLAADTAKGSPLDNPIAAQVERTLALGDHLQLRCRLAGSDSLVTTNVPRHVAARYNLSPGALAAIRLRGDDIHLMAE